MSPRQAFEVNERELLTRMMVAAFGMSREQADISINQGTPPALGFERAGLAAVQYFVECMQTLNIDLEEPTQ
jgi:hypothetical protein